MNMGSVPGIHALVSVLTEQTLDYLHPKFFVKNFRLIEHDNSGLPCPGCISLTTQHPCCMCYLHSIPRREYQDNTPIARDKPKKPFFYPKTGSSKLNQTKCTLLSISYDIKDKIKYLKSIFICTPIGQMSHK